MKKDIIDKIKTIIKEKYETENVSYVPSISNSKLTFGNTGLIFESTVLYIDLRNSTTILNNHNKSTVAKLLKSYYYAIMKIARSLDGEPRSFNGDSLLVFFQGTTKTTLSNAVTAAMKMKYILSINKDIQSQFSNYSKLDYGIGIDDGKILCAKVGLGGDSDNKDLVWIGNAVNASTVLSDKGKSPNQIHISSYVYSNLTDEVKFDTKKDAWGNQQKVDIWTRTTYNYNNETKYCYYTSYHWNI